MDFKRALSSNVLLLLAVLTKKRLVVWPHPRLIMSDTALNSEWPDWKRLKPTYTTLLHEYESNHNT